LLRRDERELDKAVVFREIFVDGFADGQWIVCSSLCKTLMVLLFRLARIGADDFRRLLEETEAGGGIVHVLRRREDGLVINDFQDALREFRRAEALRDLRGELLDLLADRVVGRIIRREKAFREIDQFGVARIDELRL
jgi:hypothetical protein